MIGTYLISSIHIVIGLNIVNLRFVQLYSSPALSRCLYADVARHACWIPCTCDVRTMQPRATTALKWSRDATRIDNMDPVEWRRGVQRMDWVVTGNVTKWMEGGVSSCLLFRVVCKCRNNGVVTCCWTLQPVERRVYNVLNVTNEQTQTEIQYRTCKKFN